MATYQTLEKITDQIRQNKSVYWKILASNGRDIQAKSPQDAGLSADKSIELLEGNLNGLTGDYVIITASENSDFVKRQGGNNMHDLKMYYKLQADPNEKAGMNMSGGMLGPYIQLLDKHYETQLNYEKERREREAEEGINGPSGTLDTFLNKLMDDPEIKGSIAGLIRSFSKKNNSKKNEFSLNGNGEISAAYLKLENTIRPLYKDADQLAVDFAEMILAEDKPADAIKQLHAYLKTKK